FKQFIEARPEGQPFCFWFGSSDPHRGYKWQSGLKSGMRLVDVVVPAFLADSTEIRTDICDYYWEIQRFDHQIGQLLQVLEDTGELDNTLIVVTSDNGMPFPRAKTNRGDGPKGSGGDDRPEFYEYLAV
ncbi:MAG: sulfatase-like hydrolase/transferase, partial [Planctomycetota bacterium]